MPAGRRTTYVTLSEIVNDNTPVTFTPGDAWVEVKPSAPGAFDESGNVYLVEMDYHPQMTTNTILTLDSGQSLYVRGFQDVDNRHVTHALYCTDVLTP